MDPEFETLRWLAAATAVVAAVIVAARFAPRVTGYGFVVFLASSVLWVAIGLLEDKLALVFQNIVLTAINAYGVYRWLIRDD